MKALIEEIRNELQQICPEHLTITKKKYATQEEIDAFQEQSGLRFPQDLVDFWLHCDFEITLSTEIYKRLSCDDGPCFFMLDEFEYLVPYWEENAGHDFDTEFPEGPYFSFEGRGYQEGILSDKVFDRNWFPVGIDSYDGAICIDLNPGPNGISGQLLYMMYVGDGKSGPYYSGFGSFKELLMHHLQVLKTRRIEIEENIIYPLNPFLHDGI